MNGLETRKEKGKDDLHITNALNRTGRENDSFKACTRRRDAEMAMDLKLNLADFERVKSNLENEISNLENKEKYISKHS